MRHGSWIALACALCLSASAYTYGLHRNLEGRVDALLQVRLVMAPDDNVVKASWRHQVPDGPIITIEVVTTKRENETGAAWMARHAQSIADALVQFPAIQE